MDPNTPEDLYAILYDQMLHTIGLLFGALLTGTLLTLGISSVLLLSSKGSGEGLSKRNRFLRAYVIVLLLVVLTFDIEGFILGNPLVIFSSQPPQKVQEFLGVWGKVLGSTPLMVGLLTDGILVWRCFMVQRALGSHNSSKWGNMSWVFPACLWVITLVTGSITVALADAHDPAIFPGIPGAIGIASNSALNIYATLFLTTRLLAHRRMVRAVLGNKALTLPHLYIIGILLESAAVNLPIVVAVAVGLGTRRSYGVVVGLVAAPSQALASVIIIHQVALGRAFSRRGEDDLRTQPATSELSLSS